MFLPCRLPLGTGGAGDLKVFGRDREGIKDPGGRFSLGWDEFFRFSASANRKSVLEVSIVLR